MTLTCRSASAVWTAVGVTGDVASAEICGGQRCGTAAQRRGLARVPVRADHRLGAPQIDSLTHLVRVRPEHDHDPLQLGDRALGRHGVVQQRPPVELGQQLRLVAEPRAGTGGQNQPRDHAGAAAQIRPPTHHRSFAGQRLTQQITRLADDADSRNTAR